MDSPATPCCTIQKVNACRARLRSFDLCPSSLISRHISATISIGLKYFNIVIYSHESVPLRSFHYLGFQFLHRSYLILQPSLHLGRDYHTQRLANQVSSVHQTINTMHLLFAVHHSLISLFSLDHLSVSRVCAACRLVAPLLSISRRL